MLHTCLCWNTDYRLFNKIHNLYDYCDLFSTQNTVTSFVNFKKLCYVKNCNFLKKVSEGGGKYCMLVNNKKDPALSHPITLASQTARRRVKYDDSAVKCSCISCTAKYRKIMPFLSDNAHQLLDAIWNQWIVPQMSIMIIYNSTWSILIQ